MSLDKDKQAVTDISSESFRIYTYANGDSFRINSPKELYVLAVDNHRVVDDEGMSHRPTRGWVGISWMPRLGAPAFVR